MIEWMILACPSCDLRYDVSGLPVGQAVRCRCGTVSTIPAPSEQAGMLACPRCGGAVAPTSPACTFCATALLLKACPRCLSRVFHGHKHCPECGAGLEDAAMGAPRGDAACPRCDRRLLARRVSDIVIDECEACHGVFLDQIAVQRIVTDRRQARAEALLGALARADVPPPTPGARMYVKCPTCRKLMNRKQFATGAHVVIDVCKADGTFFDAGELPRIIEFVMRGGLEAAERADIERLREQARRELAEAQAAKRDAFSMPGPSHFGGDHRVAAGTAVVDFLLSLFH